MRRRVTGICALGLFLASAWPAAPSGQPPSSATLDVVLVLDNSGSMRKADPGSLMRQAVTTFAADLPSNSRLAIVLFDERVRVALDLTPAADRDLSSRVAESLKQLDYSGRLTDIPAGVERAIYALRSSSSDSASRAVVLFTDGVVETGHAAADVERARWLRDSLAAEAKRLGIRVFGIAFTEAADFQLMQSLAQTTGAEYFRVLAAEDLAGAFGRIALRVRETPVAPAPATAPAPVAPAAPPERDSRLVWFAGIAAVVLLLAVVVVRRRASAARMTPSVAAHLRDVDGCTGKEIHRLNKAAVGIGRDDATNDVVIPHETVSARHAVVEFRGGAFYCRDLRSANGSFLNGKKFSDAHEMREVVLKHGDRLRFDAYEFELVEEALREVQQTQLAKEALGGAVGGTRLRDEPPVAPRKPADPQPAPAEDTPATRLKPEMCPHHPAWKATELCPVCQVPKCKSCMTQKDGRPICATCAAAADAAGSPS